MKGFRNIVIPPKNTFTVILALAVLSATLFSFTAYAQYPPSVRVTANPGEQSLTIKWNGVAYETLGIVFEGYNIYVTEASNPGAYDYVVGYDVEDFTKHVRPNSGTDWLFNEWPLTRAEIQSRYFITNPLLFSSKDPFYFNDSQYYFTATSSNTFWLTDTSIIHKMYPSQPRPPEYIVQNPDLAREWELTPDGFLRYFEYRYILEDLEPLTEYDIDIRLVRMQTYDSFAFFSLHGSPASGITDEHTGITDNGSDYLTPASFAVHQNIPNPFNPETNISFDLPSRADVSVTVYNILGRVVSYRHLGEKPAGRHTVSWAGRDDSGRSVAGGVYFYRINAGEMIDTKKMILLK